MCLPALTKIKQGNSVGGEDDITAAKAIQTRIEDTFKGYGINR